MGFPIFIRLFFNFILERLRNVFVHHKNIVHLYDIFLCGIGDSHDFIVVLLCNMNPCGLTLTLLRKRPRHAPYESPCLHHKNIVHLYDIFYVG